MTGMRHTPGMVEQLVGILITYTCYSSSLLYVLADDSNDGEQAMTR